MGFMATLTILGDPPSDYLKLEVVGRRFDTSESSYFDRNLLNVATSVHVGGFDGLIGAEIRTDEFRKFRDELALLYQNLDGEARLYVLQGWVDLTFRGDGLGHVEVRGTVTDYPGIGNVLKFELGIDQTFLPDLISQLDNLESEYPTLGKPVD